MLCVYGVGGVKRGSFVSIDVIICGSADLCQGGTHKTLLTYKQRFVSL